MTILEFFRDLGLFGIGVAAIAYLAKKLTAQLLDKELEQFKSRLQEEADKNRFQFERLHTERAKVIAELYTKLVDMENSFQTAMAPFKPSGSAPLIEDLKIAQVQYNEFINYFHSKRIYFRVETCNIIEEIITISHHAWIEFTALDPGGPNAELYRKESFANWRSAWDKAKKKLPDARSKLELEFRGILGSTR